VQDTEAIAYSETDDGAEALQSLTDGLVDWLVADGPIPTSTLGEAKLQVPLVGAAIVTAYSLSALSADDALVRLQTTNLAWRPELR
jgi:hypothetical protein